MGASLSQTSPLQVTFLPVTGAPGMEQPPRPQQTLGATPRMLQPLDQLNYNFNIMQSGQSQPGMQSLQMEPYSESAEYPELSQPAASGFNPEL